LFGLGAIGRGIGRLAAQRQEIEIAGAVDIAPELAGRPLAEVLEMEAPGLVENDAAAALARAKPALVLHATGSYLPDVLPQLLTCARAGANVVSTCEELSYPYKRHVELAKQLDAEARAGNMTMLGTGVNPGFVMDTLAVVLSGVCQEVEHVRLLRVVDVATRREQLQRKVGAGLTIEEFKARAAGGRFGHVGLQESCWLLAEALGWRLDSLEERLEPEPGADGLARGQRQTAVGKIGERTVIEALVLMAAGAEARDDIELRGRPPVHMTIEGGVAGDTATAAVVVNAARRVLDARPGLITMLDLPPITGVGSR
jgi:4-hydroxy-tetrahydrodipicolinate reductase